MEEASLKDLEIERLTKLLAEKEKELDKTREELSEVNEELSEMREELDKVREELNEAWGDLDCSTLRLGKLEDELNDKSNILSQWRQLAPYYS